MSPISGLNLVSVFCKRPLAPKTTELQRGVKNIQSKAENNRDIPYYQKIEEPVTDIWKKISDGQYSPEKRTTAKDEFRRGLKKFDKGLIISTLIDLKEITLVRKQGKKSLDDIITRFSQGERKVPPKKTQKFNNEQMFHVRNHKAGEGFNFPSEEAQNVEEALKTSENVEEFHVKQTLKNSKKDFDDVFEPITRNRIDT